jgi:hypothetical protein
MKNISGQYQDLLEGKITQAQFLRNARMMFPNYVTNHNSFQDSVTILKQKGMLVEGDAVKGAPDKEPTYDYPTQPAKYKKVVQEPEVDEQDGIYPATTLTDIPKEEVSKPIKSKTRPDGLEPIKDNDTKNEMKKVKVVKEGIHDKDITSAPHTNIKTPPKGVGDYDPKARAASLARLQNMGPKKDLKENPMKTNKIPADSIAVITLLNRVPQLANKTRMINDANELQQILDYFLDRINPSLSVNPTQLRTALNNAIQANIEASKAKKPSGTSQTSPQMSTKEKLKPVLEKMIQEVLDEMGPK